MGEVEYTNLLLSFKQRGDREYEVTATSDGGAIATSTFTIPMSDEALQDAIRNLSETRSALTGPTTRKITPVTEHGVTAQEFGSTLANALITGDVATMFDAARSRGAVRMRLNMTTEPELLRIPWEFLRRNGKDLASQRDCTLVRELVTAEPARPYLVEGKIRMLGVIANPRHDLDVDGEKRRVSEALEKCHDQVELEWLEDCTFKSLQRKLQDTYHILHFVGHSAFTDEGDSIILLSDENGMAKEQSADSIAQLIGRQNSLQLVVFNSCDGARTKLDDPFASIATMLVQQGQSAVIAMQFEISDPAAKAFAEELYFCLIDRRYPIDAAVAEARIAMLDVNQIEFATPVLFLRPGFVELFNFKPAVPASETLSTAPLANTSAAVGLPPPKLPGASPASAGAPGKPAKSKRWMIAAGAGLAAVAAGIVAVVATTSGGDDKAAVDTTPPSVESEPPVPTTISGDSYLTILHCVESDLFIEPYFDADSPEWSVNGIGQCDLARQQLEADGLDTEPMYSTIVDRMNEASALGALIDEGTDTPDDHQAFADNGGGLYDELRPALRTFRGLDPDGGVVFATDLGDEATDGTDVASDIEYQTITDDTGVLTVDVPTEWSETDTAPLTLEMATEAGYAFALGDLTEAPWIKASPSIADLDSGYETPGLIFTALPPQDSLDDTLTAFAPPDGACTVAPIEDYSDGVYTGRFQSFTDCGGTSSMVVTVAAVPEDSSFTAIIAMQIVSDADLEVLDQVIASFSVTL
jgi:hypothetical protein